MAMKVSIIIPSYNCEKYLPVALESALQQTYQDFEIVIVDDGSRDTTRQIVDKYSKDSPDKIRYIYQDNQGLAVARNTGIKAAKGQLIALLDADDVWLPDRLQEGIRIMESDQNIGLVHANITRISEEGEIIGTPKRQKQFLTGSIFEHIFLRKADIPCPTVLFRKECCNRVGLFDPNLARLGCEDRDLWLRIAQKYKIVYVDKVLALYRMRSGSMSDNRQIMMEARCYVVDKFCPNGVNVRLRKLALARIYRDLGDELLLVSDFDTAKKQYLQSLKYAPLSFWPWINLLKSLLKKNIQCA
jgi:glycosyltransferase involved in cell wall biosynthesis